jgi:hypothetical protein
MEGTAETLEHFPRIKLRLARSEAATIFRLLRFEPTS